MPRSPYSAGVKGRFLAAGSILLALAACEPARRPQPAPPPPPPPPTASATAAPAAPDPCQLPRVGEDGLTHLERAVERAVGAMRFEEVMDLGPTEDQTCDDARCVPAPIQASPSVDVAVIAFEPGCAPALASVMRSPTFQGPRRNRLDPETLAVTGVRFRRWDQDRWDGKTTGPLRDKDDLLRPPPRDGVDFSLPYPASVFKLMVAVKLLEQVDRKKLRLEEPFAHADKTRPLGEYLADMLTWSDDESTQALVRRLHALGVADQIDATFARLGLSTLQLQGTSKKTGRSWHPGKIHMGAWDTARLLWLLDPDAPPPSWRAPDGQPVDTAFLSPASKRLLLDHLAEQAFHDALSTTSLCGIAGAQPGIPALVPSRWIGEDGRVKVETGTLGGDVRPCNARADVTFAHKTGLTLNFGSDAGIVRGIPGKARRHYAMALISNLGYRYTDADRLGGGHPCREMGVCYTKQIGKLAGEIDAVIRAAVER
jgi:hypothetical protein